MIGLLGKKLGMTQVFDEEGKQIPVTILKVGPCWVTDIRTDERDGYQAVQLGFDAAKEKHLSRPQIADYKKKKVSPVRFVREIRTAEVDGISVGQQLKVDNFEVGDKVDIEGTSIGKGFQGVVKRHGYKGAQTKSHGSKHGRETGSIGNSAYPSRVFKGKGMAGQMGNENVTTQNLRVVQVDQENDLLVVRGAVQGSEGSYLVIRTSLKKGPKDRKWKVLESATKKEKKEEKATEAAAPVEETAKSAKETPVEKKEEPAKPATKSADASSTKEKTADKEKAQKTPPKSKE